jgi:hypothetical protein
LPSYNHDDPRMSTVPGLSFRVSDSNNSDWIVPHSSKCFRNNIGIYPGIYIRGNADLSGIPSNTISIRPSLTIVGRTETESGKMMWIEYWFHQLIDRWSSRFKWRNEFLSGAHSVNHQPSYTQLNDYFACHQSIAGHELILQPYLQWIYRRINLLNTSFVNTTSEGVWETWRISRFTANFAESLPETCFPCVWHLGIIEGVTKGRKIA